MKKITSLFALGAMLLLGSTKAYAETGDALDRTGWTVKASSWCWDSQTEGHCNQVLDGVKNFWHSNWGSASAEQGHPGGSGLVNAPEYLIIDLGEVKSNIGGIGYLGRTSDNFAAAQGNGALKDFKVFVSETPFELEAPAMSDEAKAVALNLTGEVISGTFEHIPTVQKAATASAVSGRYVAIVWLSSYGDVTDKWANCDEIYVYEYTNDAKPALIEKIAQFQANVTTAGSLLSVNPGCYTQAAIDAATAAISAAQAVVDNEASTNEEELAAIAALEEAVAAFTTNPIVSGIYKIVCAFPEYKNKQGSEKAICANGTALAWANEDDSNLVFYWNLVVAEDGVITIQNAATKTWISGMGALGETAAAVTFNTLGEGQFNIQCGGTFHTNGHSNGAGVAGNIVSWAGGANTASSWKLVAVEEIPQEVVDAWEWINSDMEAPIVPGKRASKLENGKQYMIFNTAYNGTEDRTGFLYSNSGSFGHNATPPSALKLTANSQWCYVWTVETTESGKYYIKTYDGKYVNNKGGYVDTPYEFTIDEWTASTVERAGVSSLAEDGETIIANAEITADNKVWTVSCDASGNDKCWNGNPGSFATWASAHPYAFYEISVVSDEEEMAAAIATANEVIAFTGVGYPAADAAERLALETLLNSDSSAEGYVDALTSALTAYLTSTDVQMPEDGKSYVIKSVVNNGVQRYFNYTEEGYTLVDYTDGDEYPETATVVAKKLADGQYTFVNKAGKYFIWKGSNAGYNDNKGYQDEYDEHAVLTVEKLVAGDNVSATNDKLFGYLAIKGHRVSPAQLNYFVVKTAGGFDQASVPFYNANFSSAILFEEVAPLAAGNYYLKNVESGMFLGAGNSWGTQASLVAHPEHVTLAEIDGAKYTLESRISNGGTKHYLGADGFMDNGTPMPLEFAANGEYFTIKGGEAYIGYDGTSTVMALNLAADAPGALWQVVSEADMKASLATATAEVPVDATFLIKDHNFGRNHRDKDAWTKTNAAAGGADANNCLEAWKKTFSVSQSLADVPNGVYALTAQGFYRVESGGQAEPLPVFFANEATSPFLLRTGTENSMGEASASFTNGLYTIAPIYVEVTDGTLAIGAKSENAGLWQIWDHFSLKYYGQTTIAEVQKVEFVKAYNAALAAAQEAAGLAMFEADKAAIDQAIAANTLDTAAATQEELATATDALKAAVAVAEKAAVKYANAQRAAEKIADVDGNFTEFIVNPGFEVNGAEGWTFEGTAINAAGNKNFELLTGEYFAEAWVPSGSTLADGKLTQTIEGLPAGTYTLTAEMKNTQDGTDAKGFFLQLGTERAEVSAPGTYTVTYEYDGTGALEVAAVLEGCTGNWVCVDNFQLSFPVSPDNVVADPVSGSTVEGKLAPVTLTFSDYDVIAVNPENLTPFSISENGGEMMAVKKGIFVDENTEDNSVVMGIDFWGTLSPIATAPGTYTIEIPAGNFLLGAEKVASKKVTLTYTVEAYKPVTPAVEVSLEEGNNVKLLFTEYAAAITNTECADKIVVKSGEEIVKELTQADVDYATEWNGLVVKAGLGDGVYTIEIPANIFLFAESETEEPKIPNAAFAVTVATVDNVVTNPENGSTVEGQLNPITLTFSDYKVIAFNPENAEMVTVAVDGAEPVTFKLGAFFDENAEDNSVVFGVGMSAKDAIITEPGTYTFVIPAGKFLLGDEKTPSKKITLTYTVEAKELVVPVCEASLVENGNVKLLFPDAYMVSYDDMSTDKIVIKSGDEVVVELGANKLAYADEYNAIVIEAGLTQLGTYTVEVPAGMVRISKDMFSPAVIADAFTVTVTVVADGITSVKANGEDKAYTLSGNRARKNYKGVVIVNGKRYIRK